MINISLLFSLSILFSGLFVFVMNKKHLLTMLLSLEYMVLGVFMLIILFLTKLNYEMFFSMMFLTLSVCEGALGLSILVSMIRTHGNDYFQSFSILW